MDDGMRPLRPYSLRAAANFRARLEELGAELLEPEWLGAQKKHLVRCRNGHLCNIRPASIQQGGGVCRTCAGKDPVEAERAFRLRMAELGATVLGPYAGNRAKIHAVCNAGHDCYPVPGQVRGGRGVCSKCAGNDPAECEAKFRQRLAELGATPLYETWLGSGKPHEVRCASGHLCGARPSGVLSGEGICRICAGNSPEAAEAAFRTRLAELGAMLLEPKWLGSGSPHHVRDAAGHDVFPLPGNVRAGWGICKTCAEKDPALAEANFRAALAEMGATPLYDRYLGCKKPHLVLCAEGHKCQPSPSSVQRGQGICLACAHRDHSAFYVLGHATEPVVKFGITSLDGRARLGGHRRDGYTTPHLLVTDLPQGAAKDAEDAVRSALALAGEKPVRGREYFDASCLALILDVAASWLGAAA